jgi:hypothetical protein
VVTWERAGAQDPELVLELLEQAERSTDVSLRRCNRTTDRHGENVGQIALADKEEAAAAWGNLPCNMVADTLWPPL